MVEEVEPRDSELSDPSVANVEQVLLVFALDRPPFEPQSVRAAPAPPCTCPLHTFLPNSALAIGRARLQRERAANLRVHGHSAFD